MLPSLPRSASLAAALLSLLSLSACTCGDRQPAGRDAGEAVAVLDDGGIALSRAPLTAEGLSPYIRTVGREGAVPQGVLIELGYEVAEPAQLNRALERTRVRLEPEHPVTVSFSSRTALTVTPTRPFAYGTKYAVTLEEVETRDGVLKRPAGAAAWTTSFETPPFAFLRAWAQEVDYAKHRVEVHLEFTGPITAASVAPFLSAKVQGSPWAPQKVRQAGPSALSFLLEGPLGGGNRIEIDLRAGVPDAPRKATAPAATAALDLPDGKPARIVSAGLREGPEGFYLDVVCTDEAAGGSRYHWDPESEDVHYLSRRCRITDTDAQRFIRLSPKVDFRIGPSARGFRIVADFKRGPYELTISAGATTIDGGVIFEPFRREFAIPARSPRLGFASSGRYLPRSAWRNLALTHVNADAAQLSVRQIPPENLVFWLSQQETEAADGRTSDVILQKEVRLRGGPDEEATTWVDLASMLPASTRGVLEISLQSGGARASSRLLLTEISLVAKRAASPPNEKWRQEVRVWAFGIRSTEPLEGVELSLKRASGKTVAECRTGAGGSCVLAVKEADPDPAEPFAIVARKGDDLTYVRYSDLETPTSDFVVHGEPYTSEKAYRAALWTDRGVYRPGETAHVAGLVRGRDDVAPPAGLPIDLKLVDPRGRVSRELRLQTNEAGLFEAELAFPSFADTGGYRATLAIAKADVGTTSFNVEEFVPERMKVDATPVARDLSFGDEARFAIEAKYLFGGSAEGSRVELTCSLEPSAFKPEQNASFVYGAQQVGEEIGDEKPVALGKVDGSLDASGKALLRCPELDGTGFRGAGRLVGAVAVFEAGSGRSTQGRATAAVHPEKFYLGLKTGAQKAQAQTPFTVEGLVVDWKGAPLATAVREVEVEFFRLDSEWGYYWDEEQGTERYERSLRPVLEGSKKVPVKDGRFSFEARPGSASVGYLVRAKAGAARTDLRLDGELTGEYWWHGAQTRVDQTPRPAKPTTLVLDVPKTVRVGEPLKVRFTAPFKGRVLVTAETDRVLDWKWIPTAAGAVTWETKVAAFAPNVYVSAFLVKDPHLESQESFLPDRAFGVASAAVAPVEFAHEVKLTVPKEIRSNARLDVGLDVGAVDKPTWAAVAVVDEGILSLTRFQSPDPASAIFVRRALGVKTYETVGWTLLLPPSGASSRTGGDATEADAPGRVQPVKPVALWSGWVKLDGQGKATIPFAVPQYRGALRVMAVVAGAKRMGAAAATVTVRDPLVLQTTLPRFLAAGDEFQIPVFVTNLSGAPQEVTISLAAESLPMGGALSRLDAMSPLRLLGKPEGKVRLENGRSSTVVFQARAVLPTGAAKLRVTAKAGPLVSKEELDVPFLPAGPRERIVQRLEVGVGPHDLKPRLTGWLPGSERTTIWLTGNPYADSFDHLSYLIRYPYGCIEQTTSSTRPLLYVSELIQSVDPTLTANTRVEDMVMSGVNRVLSMQTPSGGFGYWIGDPNPTAWGTAYATHMLLDAQKAGYAVPKERLDQVLAWIEQRVARFEAGAASEYGDHGWNTGAEPYMHYVLALAGRGQKARIQKLVEANPDAQASGRRRGARAEELYMLQAALWLSGDRRYERELKSPDASPILSDRRNDWSFYSDQRRRGFMLSTFQDLFGNDPAAEPLAQRVAESLRGHRSGSYSTQELVWGITGLGKRVREFSRDFKPGVLLANGKALEPAPGRKGGERTWSIFRASEHSQLTVDVKDAGKSGKLFLVLTSEGARAKADWQTGGVGLRLSRRYRALDGSEIDLRKPMALADLAFVEVEIANMTRERIQNIALVDRLPAGWEIENPRLGRSTPLAWAQQGELWAADFLNVRDDRLEVFGALNPGERRKVVYGVRAVTSGRFTLPPVEAEAMYDPSVWAREPGGEVRIDGDWQEYLL